MEDLQGGGHATSDETQFFKGRSSLCKVALCKDHAMNHEIYNQKLYNFTVMGQESGIFTAETASHQLTRQENWDGVSGWHHTAPGVHTSLNQCWLRIPSTLNSTEVRKKKWQKEAYIRFSIPR